MPSWKLPSSLPGGDMLPFMSARHRTNTIDAIFEATGGFSRAVAWADRSDENYGEFFKIWAKGAVRATTTEHTASASLEDALAKLDAGEHARVVEGEIIE